MWCYPFSTYVWEHFSPKLINSWAYILYVLMVWDNPCMVHHDENPWAPSWEALHADVGNSCDVLVTILLLSSKIISTHESHHEEHYVSMLALLECTSNKLTLLTGNNLIVWSWCDTMHIHVMLLKWKLVRLIHIKRKLSSLISTPKWIYFYRKVDYGF